MLRALGIAVLLAPLGGCEGGEGPSGGPRGGGAPALEDMRAVGYAGWSDGGAEPVGVAVREGPRPAEGLNLYADGRDRVLLVDMAGRLVHVWRIEGFSSCEYAALLDGGRVLALSVDEGVALVGADSRTSWRLELNAHHEVAPLADGTFLVPVWEERRYRGRRVRFDRVVRISERGELLDSWFSLDQLDELRRLHPPLPLDTAGPPGREERGKVYDYYHLNSIAELPETALGRSDPRFRAGNLLLCFRNASLLVVLDGETHEPLWHWGPGELDFPHMPRMLEDGRILVLDNGWHRGWSRVLELDPLSLEIVWSYVADPPEAFFTKRRGSCQRLPGGSTLICESQTGRAFEVSPAGEILWQLHDPERRGAKRRLIYRMLRVPAEQVPFRLDPPPPTSPLDPPR